MEASQWHNKSLWTSYQYYFVIDILSGLSGFLSSIFAFRIFVSPWFFAHIGFNHFNYWSGQRFPPVQQALTKCWLSMPWCPSVLMPSKSQDAILPKIDPIGRYYTDTRCASFTPHMARHFSATVKWHLIVSTLDHLITVWHYRSDLPSSVAEENPRVRSLEVASPRPTVGLHQNFCIGAECWSQQTTWGLTGSTKLVRGDRYLVDTWAVVGLYPYNVLRGVVSSNLCWKNVCCCLQTWCFTMLSSFMKAPVPWAR